MEEPKCKICGDTGRAKPTLSEPDGEECECTKEPSNMAGEPHIMRGLVELKQNEYQCKMCRNVYEKGRPDEDALNESKEIFGGEPTVENSDVVCDDCWKKLGFD